MKIAALQMVSTTNVQQNCETAQRLIGEAARGGAQLVALPEYFCLMGRADRDKLAIAEAPGDGPIQRMLSDAAREHRVWVIGGTLPLRSADPDRVMNSNGVYAPDGTLAARYDEGGAILAGDTPTAVQAAALRVGLSVCYDLRFPELYRELMHPPCDLISVPAAFTYTTGLAHWELLLRARAVENQCYVIAAAQGGKHENGRRTFGHSMVVDPWGEVVAVLAEGEGVVMAEVDAARIASVRTQLPALEHRRAALSSSPAK
jgi:predicted amidohydrolase